MSKNLLLISLVLVIIYLIYSTFFKPQAYKTIKMILNGKSYSIEIADSLSKKAYGLANRSSLCQNCGMLFVFDNDGDRPFWMKDTLIPLDMIWIDSSGSIVSIQTALPEPKTQLNQLKIYQNDKPAKFVLEINAHQAENLNLQIGDKLNINL